MTTSNPTASKYRWVNKLSSFVYHHPAWILIFFLTITGLLTPIAAKLKLRANFQDLLPSDSPSIMNLKKLTSYVGGASYMIVVIESKDEETATQAAKRFTEMAEHFQQVDSVNNRTGMKGFEHRKLLFLKLESLEKLKTNLEALTAYYRRQNSPFNIDLLGDEDTPPSIDWDAVEL